MPAWTKVLLGLLSVAALVFLIERVVVTDREAITASMERVREGVLKGDVEAVLGEFAEGYHYNGQNLTAQRRLAEQYLGDYQVTVFGIVKRTIELTPGRAKVKTTLVLKIRRQGSTKESDRGAVDLIVEYAETAKGWKIAGWKLNM